ncbi:hypothetical protein M9458_043834, partial [Cirrhinus mrigala]
DLQHLLQGHICVFQILRPLVLQEISILQRFIFKAVEMDSCSFPHLEEVAATRLLTQPQRT